VSKPDWILGNEPVSEKLNVRAELKRFRENPVLPLVRIIETLSGENPPRILENELSRYLEAYEFYYLSLERFIPEMSLALRWDRGPRWVRGRGRKYTPAQRKLADRYHAVKKFIAYDFFNCLLYARILLDRLTPLSRHFLDSIDGRLPSFTSFSKHRQFFRRLKSPYGKHEEYATYIRENTDWFDMPLKAVRDKHVVHSGPQHMKVFGYVAGYEHDLTLTLLVPEDSSDLSRMQPISVSIRRLARDIDEFLKWFCAYGLRALEERLTDVIGSML